MDCSLKDASSEFQKLIENQRDNLDYLQQLKASYETAQDGMWNKCVGLVSDLLGDAFGEQIDEFLGDDLSFDTLKTAVQMVSLAKPEAFGEALKKEINNIKSFFQDELEIIEAMYNHLEYMVGKLNNEWSGLADSQILDQQQLELNELMNRDLPLAGNELNNAKNNLIAIESEVYNLNTTFNLTSNNINNIITRLRNAKGHLEKEAQTSVIESLIEFAQEWEKIKGYYEDLSNPSGANYNNLKDNFKEIGDNLKQSIEDLLATLRIIRNALNDLDTTEEKMFQEWKSTINHLIANDEMINDFSAANEIKNSIDEFINTNDVNIINLSYPLVGVAISENTFNNWEEKANLIKLNKGNWISQIDNIISMLENITQTSISNTIDSIDTIYEPITNSVIESYRTLSKPIWAELVKFFIEVDYIIRSLIEGKEITKELLETINNLKNISSSLLSLLNNTVNYFDTNNPEQAIINQLGLGNTTQGVINGLTVMADYLGLDHMSELINTGNFKDLLDLSEEDASSTQQLLNDLKCLSEATDQTRSIGMEIRKYVTNEKQRKESLRKDASKILEEGIKNKEEKIKELQSLSDNFKNKI